MPKKKRRGVAPPPAPRKKKGVPQLSAVTAIPVTEAPRPTAVAPRPAPTPPPSRRATNAPGLDLAQEYSYVRHDLRRIAVVGGGIILLLVVLSFALR